jgi:hypothetical protein
MRELAKADLKVERVEVKDVVLPDWSAILPLVHQTFS